MKKLFVLLLPAVCGACGFFPARPNEANYQRFLDDFLNRGDSYLIQRWGKPDSREMSDTNIEHLTYYRTSDEPVGGKPKNYREMLNLPRTEPMVYQEPIEYTCQTVFAVKNGIVVDYAYQGNDCVR